MKNKKKTIEEAGDTASCQYDESSNEERKYLLSSIEEACEDGNRARCYELLMDYSYKEPYEIDGNKFEEAKYNIYLPGLGPAECLISNDNSLEDIMMYMNILTILYKMGFFCKERTFIVKAFNSKTEALITSEKTLNIIKKISQTFNYDICDDQIDREICIYGNEKHRPKWMDENGDNPSLDQWRMHPEEWYKCIGQGKGHLTISTKHKCRFV